MNDSPYLAAVQIPCCEVDDWLVTFAKVKLKLKAGALLVGVRRRVSGGGLELIPLGELEATLTKLPPNVLVKDELLGLACPVSETEHLSLARHAGLFLEPEHKSRPRSPEGEWNGA